MGLISILANTLAKGAKNRSGIPHGYNHGFKVLSPVEPYHHTPEKLNSIDPIFQAIRQIACELDKLKSDVSKSFTDYINSPHDQKKINIVPLLLGVS